MYRYSTIDESQAHDSCIGINRMITPKEPVLIAIRSGSFSMKNGFLQTIGFRVVKLCFFIRKPSLYEA